MYAAKKFSFSFYASKSLMQAYILRSECQNIPRTLFLLNNLFELMAKE